VLRSRSQESESEILESRSRESESDFYLRLRNPAGYAKQRFITTKFWNILKICLSQTHKKMKKHFHTGQQPIFKVDHLVEWNMCKGTLLHLNWSSAAFLRKQYDFLLILPTGNTQVYSCFSYGIQNSSNRLRVRKSNENLIFNGGY